ncbi:MULTISPECIES: outer membrane beta-barrel protein [Dyella]|uniref:TIGR03016 family PEP-CTERM system-associated outer membrane protein n=2 Tax=Dyella TaxID=231454 RepID=A0A4R0YNK6_9GAMM|nr:MULTISPECIES: outer membrane beta-barrel protein [Dyella]TBR36142.1 hypothetical protein EYV96_16235 [Dyella terrae]TCI06191.1 hypothetical protein EZM97_35325 [Dyella soli]
MLASRTLARSIALALLAAAGSARAAQFNYQLYVGVEHSDNIALSDTNRIREDVLTPGANFTYLQQGSTVQANVAGTVEYRDYLHGKFDNQLQGQLAGQVNWTMIPQRLDLLTEDYAGVQPVDSLVSNAPDNQQQTNVFAIGPILHFRMGEAMTGQAELRYVNSYASKVKDFNSSRGVGALRFYRDLSQTDQLSFNMEAQHTNFDQSTSGPDYNRYEIYGRYTSQLKDLDLDAMLGWSRINFDQNGSDSKPIARFSANWRASQHNTFIFAGAYQFADAAQDMAQAPNRAVGTLPNQISALSTMQGISVGNVVVSSQVYLEKRLDLTYEYRTERFSLSLTPAWRDLDYINDHTLDQHGGSVGVSGQYRIRPTLTLSGFVDAERLTYSTLDRTDKTYRYGIDLTHQFAQNWSWRAEVTHQRRDSTFVGQSYHETTIYFGVVYQR